MKQTKKGTLEHHLKAMGKGEEKFTFGDIGKAFEHLKKPKDMITYYKKLVEYYVKNYSDKYKNPELLAFDRIAYYFCSVPHEKAVRWYISLYPLKEFSKYLDKRRSWKLRKK